MSITRLLHFHLVVKRAARQFRYLQQYRQIVALPQFEHDPRFLGAARSFS